MKHFSRSILSLLLVVLLAAAVMTGCAKPETPATTAAPAQTTAAPAQTTAVPAQTTAVPAQTEAPDVQELGEGSKLFYFNVRFADGETSAYAIHTDAETVGDALTALDLIEGEDGQYGLYVTTVCGEALDWDADHMYWAFYENGEFAMTGVDATAVADGATYAFMASAG